MGTYHLLLALLWAASGTAQDLPTCVESFDIHQDKIIRTQDSRAMGAKYINERDVPSREDCLRLCCETQDCDVFVFEEKMPGSCYLFQCGTPEDFKCKFTKHRNYTSAVLVLGRHLTELESQIKHTQHEHELAKLRQPEIEPVSITVPETSTTAVPGNKEVAPVLPTASQFVPSRHCSRYQFECHATGECIAIYNACDGIPQCSDGSDEAPELECPSQVVSTVAPIVKASSNGLQQSDQQPSNNHQSYRSNSPSVPILADDSSPPVLSKQFKNNQWTPQMFDTQHMGGSVNGYLQMGEQQSPTLSQQPAQQPQHTADFPQSPPQLISQAKQFGREGEGLLYRPPAEMMQWPSTYQQEQLLNYRASNSGGSQIFSHKGSGLVAQSDRYRHVHGNKVMGEEGISGQFEPVQQDYGRYNSYYESVPYHKPPQTPNSWQPLHKPHADTNSLAGVEENMNVLGNLPQNSLPGQDYYYEENFRTRLQPQLISQRLSPQASLSLPPENAKLKPIHKGEAEIETQEAIVEAESKTSSSNTSVKKASPSTVATNSTEKPKEAQHHSEHHHNSHRKVETLSAELSLMENSFDSEGEGQNVNPRGAILSLTMGLCVTGIMLVLVGCRMRMVRRRMRRGSKSPYAHDADFLVNGMYL